MTSHLTYGKPCVNVGREQPENYVYQTLAPFGGVGDGELATSSLNSNDTVRSDSALVQRLQHLKVQIRSLMVYPKSRVRVRTSRQWLCTRLQVDFTPGIPTSMFPLTANRRAIRVKALTSPAGKLAMGIELLWAPLHSVILMQEVCRCKLSSALSPYGAERPIRGGVFHPATTSLCVAHTCLVLVHMDACNYYHANAHISLLWMPAILPHADAHKLLPWMPAILPHADARILLSRMPANLAHAEGGPFWLAVITSYFLTSMRCWACFPAPTILGIRDPDNTRTPLIAWGRGIRGPLPDSIPSSYDDYSHPWQLDDFLRRDIEQADLAPPMSALLDPTRPGYYLLPREDESALAPLALANADRTIELPVHKQFAWKNRRLRIRYKAFESLEKITQDGKPSKASWVSKIERLISDRRSFEARQETAELRYLETIAATATLAIFWALFAAQRAPWTFYVYQSALRGVPVLVQQFKSSEGPGPIFRLLPIFNPLLVVALLIFKTVAPHTRDDDDIFLNVKDTCEIVAGDRLVYALLGSTLCWHTGLVQARTKSG
ncbi:hypothetical protein K503DRAFT_787936 [Rhizopogon vinicolor AM-OR11-026]|uniref:GPI ethanolamine phosphate transferase 1 n=1 Tax=Rhizopogon vinicolor AM-OR11-026 TaxID=1314800 RepID=A0A1B7MFB2_9AGAM|nr:hypothetical protein K503DRAFT_787936 [Rhizopogon vinicolor AM-OR11-026]